jgi:hypothetical protein
MGEDDSQRLIELIGLVADGGAGVDWQALEDAAPDESLKSAIRELRTIAGVGAVHASQVGDGLITPPPPPSPPSTELTREITPGVDPDDTTSPVLVPPAAETWGNFRLVRKIGEGSYGEVFEALDTFLDHRVALKLLKLVVERSRILHEARMLVRLRHPNVIAVHGADVHKGRLGFWMEFIDGHTLAEVVAREKVRSAGEAAVIGQDLCRALAAVHFIGIVHRDIKAQNVMRESGTGRIVLMDFGAGELLTALRSAAGRTIGTPLYLAPELFEGEPASKRSDIYATGVLLFYLVTGLFPVQAASYEELRRHHAGGIRRRLADVRPDLPDPFVRIVEKMIAPVPEHRYESANDVREALEAFVAPTVATGGTPVGVQWTWRRVLAGIAAAAGGVTFLGYIACRTFEIVMGIGPEFTSGLGTYLIVGMRALFPFIVFWVAFGAVTAAVRLAWRSLAGRWWPRRMRKWPRPDPAVAATVIFVVAVAGWVTICWKFVAMFLALEELKGNGPLSPSTLATLESTDFFNAHGLYSAGWSFLLILAVAYWFRPLERLSRDTTVVSVMKWATVAVAFLTVAMAVMPRRIVWDQFGLVQFGTQRAFVIANRGPELLLYWPRGDRPLHRRVTIGDEGLVRSATALQLFDPKASD